jgi:hypothetical protein
MSKQLRGPFEKFVDSPYYSVYVCEKWVERCKSASLAKGGTSKKRPSPHLRKALTRNNKASPQTFQMALVAPPSKKMVLLKRP